MGNMLGVTVEELVSELKRKNARMPYEIGAFVALEASEQLLKAPAAVGVRDVRIRDDGTTSVFAAANGATVGDAAQSIVDLLTYLLVAAGHGVPPVFLEIVEEPPAARGWDLARLRDELEASLVPLNRQASRRVLSRLLREASREGSIHHGPLAEHEPDEASADAELDALLGDEAPPRATSKAEAPAATQAAETVAAPAVETPPAPTTLSGMVSAPPGAEVVGAGPRQSRPEPEVRAPTPAFGIESPEPAPRTPPRDTQRRSSAPPREIDMAGIDDAPPRGGGAKWLLIFGVLVVALLAAVYAVRPDAIRALMGERAPTPEPAAPAAKPTPEARFGRLTVRTVDDAQVLLFVGEGPAIAEKLPVGVAHEFITLADGRSPTRSVVPATEDWGAGDPPTYELAMQTGETPVEFSRLDLGKTKLAGDAMGAPTGRLGNVRVVTNPPKAKVYLLIGFGPTVEVENLNSERPYELLVFSKGRPPAAASVAPADWTKLDGKLAAEVSVTP
ncbi:MAG: hypothetical protein KC417_01775 [Myxococcales bacterium]|nr:hypothetical protein [Myxococcales bacterium]